MPLKSLQERALQEGQEEFLKHLRAIAQYKAPQMEQFKKALIAFAETIKTAPPGQFLKALKAMNPVLEDVAFSLQQKSTRQPQDPGRAGAHEFVRKDKLDNLSKLGKSMSRSKAPGLKTLGIAILGVTVAALTVFALFADLTILGVSIAFGTPPPGFVTPAIWAPVLGSSSSSKPQPRAKSVLTDPLLKSVVNTVAHKAEKVGKAPEGKVKKNSAADNNGGPSGP